VIVIFKSGLFRDFFFSLDCNPTKSKGFKDFVIVSYINGILFVDFKFPLPVTTSFEIFKITYL
jgi:hypothetical protein